jgi:hypothetical protein
MFALTREKASSLKTTGSKGLLKRVNSPRLVAHVELALK